MGLVLVLVLYLLILCLFELLKDVLILLFHGVSKHFSEVHVGKVFRNLEKLGQVHIWSCFILGLNELLNQFEIAKSRANIGNLLKLNILLKGLGILVDLIWLILFQFALVVDLLEVQQGLLLIVLVTLWCL